MAQTSVRHYCAVERGVMAQLSCRPLFGIDAQAGDLFAGRRVIVGFADQNTVPYPGFDDLASLRLAFPRCVFDNNPPSRPLFHIGPVGVAVALWQAGFNVIQDAVDHLNAAKVLRSEFGKADDQWRSAGIFAAFVCPVGAIFDAEWLFFCDKQRNDSRHCQENTSNTLGRSHR